MNGGNRGFIRSSQGNLTRSINSGFSFPRSGEMSTCEENDDLINIFILISNIKEDLKKLKSLDIPTDEIQITELKVNNSLSAFI